RQEDALRQRLVEGIDKRRVYFNITFFSFYTLYARLLDMVGKPQREVDDTARLKLIRGLLTELQQNNQLTVFQKIADKPGFAKVIADFIYELKQNVVYPEAFEIVAEHGSDKDRDLAKIYTSYQAMLRQYNLIDREGEGWLALDEVTQQSKIGTDVAHLLVDGFDQFNPLQAQLLALLASRVQQTTITLPQVQGRENTLGRRFTEARQRLTTAFVEAGQSLTTHEIPVLDNLVRHTGLNHLIQNCFINGATPIAAGDGLRLIEAPDPKIEASAMMRQVKRLLLDGTSPDEILIAVRDWARYAPHFDHAAKRYGIPTVMHYGDALANNPAVIALLNLLELTRYDFRRRDVLDVLRSPYFAVPEMTDEIINQLDIISREQQIIRGRQDWLDAIQLAAVNTSDEDGEKHQALLKVEEANHLRQILETFFEKITPPESAKINQYIAWVEGLIGSDTTTAPDDDTLETEAPTYSLNMLAQIRQTNETFEARDLLALQKIKSVLRGMLATEKLFAVLHLEQTEETNWRDFLQDFKSAVGTATITNNTNRSGKILITSVTDARGLPHEHVFIPGLSEGIFPRPTPEDPIYLDSERQALTQAGIFLETQAERAADDGLFYELISLPRKTLTLSRPTIQNGAIWPESHLWRAVKVSFDDADTNVESHKIQLGGVVKAEEAAHRSEAALAVADGFNHGVSDASTNSLYNWLLSHHREHWQHISQSRDIELQRMTSPTLDHYSGRLEDAR
ncbi:MAG: 3'-5' exonuclease, partial [Chloroflexota bacterium]